MLIKDIVPKHLVLGSNIDDFSLATTKVDYSIEDLCCYVTNNIECYYWLNIESIWGPLGFVWDVINDYGHFVENNIEYNTIPVVPDGERIKRFNNTFKRLNKDIEVYKSNWINVTDFIFRNTEYYQYDYESTFIFNGDYSILNIDIYNDNFDTQYLNKGFKLNLPLYDSEVKIDNANLIIDPKCSNYFPINNFINDNLFLVFIDNIITPFEILKNSHNKSFNFKLNTNNYNITELHLFIHYNNNNKPCIIIGPFDSSDIDYNYNNIILHFHGNPNNIKDDGIFNIIYVFNSTRYMYFKDIIFEDLDNIKNHSLYNNCWSYCLQKTDWVDVNPQIYNKLVSSFDYTIHFHNDIPICPYKLNLENNATRIYIDNDDVFTHYFGISSVDNINNIYVLEKQVIPNFQCDNDIINDFNIYGQYNGVNYLILLDYEYDNFVINPLIDILFGNKVKKISFNKDINSEITIDIRNKEQIVITNNFNLIQGRCVLLCGKYIDNEYIYFTNEEVNEIKPFDISHINENNIKNYIIDYSVIYMNSLKDKYNITQSCILSNATTIIDERYFDSLNNVSIIYLYKVQMTIAKDSVLTENKFIDIINAYLFDNDSNSAKGLTLTIYTTYFNLIPKDKYEQFIADGYIIIETLN